MQEFKYETAETTYIQRPLVLGQVRQLLEVIGGVQLPSGGGAAVLIAALGDKLDKALAVVLTPEGGVLRDKDIEALAAELAFTLTPETIVQVVDDFFICNPISSIVERVGNMAEKISQAVTGSALQSVPLPAEI